MRQEIIIIVNLGKLFNNIRTKLKGWLKRPSKEGPVFLAEARAVLQRLGLGEAQIRALAEGKPVAFNLSAAAEGTLGVAQLLPKGRLRVGLYTIKSAGRGLSDFLSFEARSQAAAKAVGAREVELLAIEITNPKLQAALQRGGFTPTTMPAPEELGGGTFDALSRVYPVE